MTNKQSELQSKFVSVAKAAYSELLGIFQEMGEENMPTGIYFFAFLNTLKDMIDKIPLR